MLIGSWTQFYCFPFDFSQKIIDQLKAKYPMLSENAQEHIDWAIEQQYSKH